MEIEALFQDVVEKSTPASQADCITWHGSTTYDPNGKLRARIGPRAAARVLWERHHKVKLPRNIYVCHKCDNPLCVNLEHLFLGTQKDNMLDAVSKGRPIGRKRKPHPKETEMLKLEAKGWNHTKIARFLGLDHSTVRWHLRLKRG